MLLLMEPRLTASRTITLGDQSGNGRDMVGNAAPAGTPEQEAAALLEQYDRMSPEDQRKVLARLAGNLDPERCVLVRTPSGKVELQEVSAGVRDRVKSMGDQGFTAVSFTNRRARRAAKAKARRSAPA